MAVPPDIHAFQEGIAGCNNRSASTEKKKDPWKSLNSAVVHGGLMPQVWWPLVLGCWHQTLPAPGAILSPLWGTCRHQQPLLSPASQSLSMPSWFIWLTRNKIWRRRTDHALTCLGGIAEPSSGMDWLLWTRGSTFWRSLGRDAKTYHTLQLCSESFCGSSQEALRDKMKVNDWGARGLSVTWRTLP